MSPAHGSASVGCHCTYARRGGSSREWREWREWCEKTGCAMQPVAYGASASQPAITARASSTPCFDSPENVCTLTLSP